MLSKTSITSTIAVIAVVCCFVLLGYTLAVNRGNTTVLVQVLTIIAAIVQYPLQWLYGQSKQKTVTQSADTISNSPAVSGDSEAVTETK